MVLLCNTCLVNQQWCIIHSDRSRKVGKANLQATCRRSCPERSDNCLSWAEVGNIHRTKRPGHIIINLSIYCVQKDKEVTWSHMCMVLGQSLGNYQPDRVLAQQVFIAPPPLLHTQTPCRSCPERSSNCLSWAGVGNIHRTKWPSYYSLLCTHLIIHCRHL